ncbi:MAG: anti-phage dCTP deaminase [Mariprofundaceae bacterium]
MPQTKEKPMNMTNSATSTESIEGTLTPELVIVLCGPIGSPVHAVADYIQKILSDSYGYECLPIRLSRIIEEYEPLAKSKGLGESDAFHHTKDLIERGDLLRNKHGNRILADLAVDKIAQVRESRKKKDRYEPDRICHIIDSIKNKEELAALRSVYREMLYTVGVFSPLEDREQALLDKGMEKNEIYELIDQDSGEEFSHGQSVKDTFPKSDCFLRVDYETESQIEQKLARFFNLIFGTKVITPTIDENAMYQATSAAKNSACMSRQVGAAITSSSGRVIATGWNDVPKAFGGLYRYDPANDPNSEKDKRCCFFKKTCRNDEEKDILTNSIVSSLVNEKVIQAKDRHACSDIVRNRLRGLLEFSRSIHAEMHALITAGQLAGDQISGGSLYCTTYPCHPCARHLIAAGICNIFFIEPYHKSLATKLHNDAITEKESVDKKVRILSFDGVAPRRYLEFFVFEEPAIRKDSNGKLKDTDKRAAVPKCHVSLESIPALEGLVVAHLKEKDIFR